MVGIRIINYSVKGIKNLDNKAELSFYKRIITKGFSMRNYNVKGLYGVNGSGKSAIISSVQILKRILEDSSYLSNSLVQNQLNALINKKTGLLEISVDYLLPFPKNDMKLYHYKTILSKNGGNKYVISSESLSVEKALSHNSNQINLFETRDGVIINLSEDGDFAKSLTEQTKNLLSLAPLSTLFVEKSAFNESWRELDSPLQMGLASLFLFEKSLFVYLDSEDDHTDYIINDLIRQIYAPESKIDGMSLDTLLKQRSMITKRAPFEFSPNTMSVEKGQLVSFEQEVEKLFRFIHIFKQELVSIDIDKREEKDNYRCNLVLKYSDYSVDAEFESTGIKKLIRLFSFIQKVVKGEIVFIDELDSNLHDVYLCALLEYLIKYADGQLCFTTHNIGPMDVLKQNKKSIDFLSADGNVYSWTANGNYSPSNLYKRGMIEGSPFNIFDFDFIAAFDTTEDN